MTFRYKSRVETWEAELVGQRRYSICNTISIKGQEPFQDKMPKTGTSGHKNMKYTCERSVSTLQDPRMMTL